jgi:hypothetical protein|tara:strand:+ start:184 stop:477 length:294 start_codon:yes stop_codon:yes gene_type:complete
MSYSKNMTKKSKKTIHLGELPQAELEILRNQDPDVLATALIFVIGELIVQEYDIDQQPEIHKIVKEAAMQAIELVAGVHLTMEIDNRFPDTTERTIH